MIYLDHAATTNTKPESVVQAVFEAMRSFSVNAGRGGYSLARKATQMVDKCRDSLLNLARLKSGFRVIFSPSATVAMNQLLLGMPFDSYTNVYVSPFEHNAVMRPLHALCQKYGAKWHQLPFERQTWGLDLEATESMFLSHKPDYVIVSMVSNTTGLLLPIQQIAELAHNHGAIVIVDCAQALGSIDKDFSTLNADAYVFAGHKTLYGPYGIAGIILSTQWKYPMGLYGGTGSDSLSLDMPSADAGGFEPSSLNIPALCGLTAAVEWIGEIGVKSIQQHELNLVNHLVSELQKIDKVELFVPPLECRSNIVAFNLHDYQSADVGEILDEEFDIAVRTGYQCAPLVHEWLGTKHYGGIVRVSVSYFNTIDDVEALVNAIKTL